VLLEARIMPNHRPSRPRGVVPHSLRIATWDDYARLHAAELSRGGMFVPTSDPLPVATTIMLCLRLPDARVLEIAAEVKSVVSAARAAAGKKTAGMGLRFVEWTETLQQQLAAFVREPAPAPAPIEQRAAPPTGEARSQKLARALTRCLEQLRERDYFSALGVVADAPESQIREAFRARLLRLHPSRFALEAEPVRKLATEVFLIVKKAYDTIVSPVHSAAYRAQLETAVQPPMDEAVIQEIDALRTRGR
jgi:Tfp pilus assembly protein PilZ